MAVILVDSKGKVTGSINGKPEKESIIRPEVIAELSKKFKENEKQYMKKKRSREETVKSEIKENVMAEAPQTENNEEDPDSKLMADSLKSMLTSGIRIKEE